MNYVVGFLFGPNCDQVALIEKKKPAWQEGLLNGIGGKVESGERKEDAMIREFREETGVHCTVWRHFATLKLSDGEVWCYESRQPVKELGSPTNEKVSWCSTHYVICGELDTIPNLPWLIRMALDDDKVFATIDYSRGA